EGEPRSERDIVLREDSRRDVGVGEARYIEGAVGFALGGGADHPGVTSGGSARGELGEEHTVTVALADLAELVVVVLRGSSESRAEHVASVDDELVRAAEIVAAGVEGFFVRLARCREHRAFDGSSAPVFVGDASGDECGLTVCAVPKK